MKKRLIRADGKPRIGAELSANATEVLRIGAVAETINGKPSPAAQSGIPEGALITHVNGKPIRTVKDFKKHLKGAHELRLSINRKSPVSTGISTLVIRRMIR